MSEELSRPKILVVTESYGINDPEERNQDILNSIIRNALKSIGADMYVETSDINSDYDIDVDSVMHHIDSRSKDLCIDEYACVIAEGLSSWFWERSKYRIPVISLNPATDIYESFSEKFSDVTFERLDSLASERNESRETDDIFCVISNDGHISDPENAEDEYGRTNVFVSDYDLQTEEFWNDNSEILTIISRIINETSKED